ncbi:hypothetical protein BC629DRAFT_1008805 [Irpex lacteus]|nr:hypothetical protein BC629DRAFT_1008805 [Irpex lacteus]
MKDEPTKHKGNLRGGKRLQFKATYLSTIPEPTVVHPVSPPSKTFYYNPVHDLESLWWIAVYFVINKETRLAPVTLPPQSAASPDDPPQDTQAFTSPLTDAQRKYARELFYTRLARRLALDYDSDFDDQAKTWPAHLQPICQRLITLKNSLRRHYKKIERVDHVITKDVCGVLYQTFADTFYTIACDLSAQDIIVAPMAPDPYAEGMWLPARQMAESASSSSATEATNSKDKSGTQDHSSHGTVPVPRKHGYQTRSSTSAEASTNTASREGGSVPDKGKGRVATRRIRSGS